MPVVPVWACFGYEYRCCVGHVVRPKSKQGGGICLARQFKTSVGSERDADCTEKRKLQFHWHSTG